MYFLGVFVVAPNFHLPTEEVRPNSYNLFGFNMTDTGWNGMNQQFKISTRSVI